MFVTLRTLITLALTSLAANHAPALSQDYPTKPIKLIVPFPAGGPSDVLGRLMGEKAATLLGQPVVIENRPGAAGVTGVAFVSRAEPDGYTLAISASSTLSINHVLQDKPPFDPLTDLKLVSQLVSVPEVLVVGEAVPARTLAELIALAKAQPGKLNYATPGIGTISHLVMELLKVNTGIDVAHVPYSGAAPAVNDLLGGHVQMLFADVPVMLGAIKGGKLRPLAVGSEHRAPDLPDVPTARELGWHEVVADNWYGLVAPPQTPPAVIAKIHAAMVGALRSNEVRAKLEAQGNIIVGSTPDAFLVYVKSEIAKWSKVITAAGVKSR